VQLGGVAHPRFVQRHLGGLWSGKGACRSQSIVSRSTAFWRGRYAFAAFRVRRPVEFSEPRFRGAITPSGALLTPRPVRFAELPVKCRLSHLQWYRISARSHCNPKAWISLHTEKTAD
jgi:hypothetical protein